MGLIHRKTNEVNNKTNNKGNNKANSKDNNKDDKRDNYISKMTMLLRNNYDRLLLTLSAVCFIGVWMVGMMRSYASDISIGLRHNVVRFHVLANSDSQEDQILKLHVRDVVMEYMSPILKDSSSVEETKKRILLYQDEIQAIAKETIEKSGYDYDVQVSLAEDDFPTKSYGDVVLPAGTYEACRIVIGDGKGKNWWCVMFPPLCYVDAASGVVPVEGKEELEKALTPEQYKVIQPNEKRPYELRFKVVELFNARYEK